MSDEKPAPLTSADCDLRGYEYFPLYGERMLTSDTWIRATAEAKVAALRLWWKAWLQVPAASLPDDDVLLADLAGYGVAVSAWKRVRVAAMRGWVLCDDGRWYHPFLAELATTAYASRAKHAAKQAADRERLAAKRSGVAPESRRRKEMSQRQTVGVADEAVRHRGDNPLRGEDKSGIAKAIPPEPRGSRLCDTWAPSPDDEGYARNALGIGAADVATIAEHFKNYWLSAAGAKARKVDWSRAWRAWIAKEKRDGRSRNGSRTAGGQGQLGLDRTRQVPERRGAYLGNALAALRD